MYVGVLQYGWYCSAFFFLPRLPNIVDTQPNSTVLKVAVLVYDIL
jgi:hypothetical protein